MKVAASSLLPILRSDTVGDLLALLYLRPERQLTLTDLAREVGVSLPTVVREIDRMLASGLVLEERVGRARRVRANRDSVLFSPLAEIVALTYGPRPVLEEMLAPLDGIDGAIIYGSWAARYRGEQGSEPNDVDVLVWGQPDPDQLFETADRARQRLHREVSIRMVPTSVWEDTDPADPFLRHVRARPMVELRLQEEV